MSPERLTTVTTPLGPSALLFRRMTGVEHLGTPFEYRVEFSSGKEDLKFDDMLAQPITVKLGLQQGGVRYFNGLCSRFAQAGRTGPYVIYEATLRPWLWFLTRTSTCRIFQDKTAVDIIKAIFRDRGFTDFSESLSGSYQPLGYCVQYRESDFNFVSRLMEQEGIYYYFKHSDGKHTLVLSDSYSAHDPLPGYKEIPFYPPTENVVREDDYVWEWDISREVQSGTYTLNDFDFEKPKAGLVVKSSLKRKHPHADFEVYDYPGDYITTSQGETYAKTRIEELQGQFKTVRGKGNPRGMMSGGLFSLAEHPRKDQNREHLVVAVEHDIQSQEYASIKGPAEGPTYTCSFTALDSKEVYRPPRITRKPFVQGPQTAIVVGKGGEEIWTDKYGRVKVHFHWDKDGKTDENSSCWVRVAQVWAGTQWGGIQIPRMGQEVIVDFLEGDPDRPIITGRVYNADQMPPYNLPANQTQSGIKSRSSKGGVLDNANEIRFEDKKGDEQVLIHAEKDMATEVEHDQTTWVGHDRHKTVDNDQTEEIKGFKTITVYKDHKEEVRQNMSLRVVMNENEAIGGNRAISVAGEHTESIGGSQGVTVAKDGAWAVGGNGSMNFGGTGAFSIGKKLTQDVGADYSLSVADNMTMGVGKAMNLTVTKALSIKVEDAMTTSVTKDSTVTIEGANKNTVTKAYGLEAKEITIEGKDQITIKCGSAEIVMKKNGDIVIKGNKINIKGDGDVVLKGSKIAQN